MKVIVRWCFDLEKDRAEPWWENLQNRIQKKSKDVMREFNNLVGDNNPLATFPR